MNKWVLLILLGLGGVLPSYAAKYYTLEEALAETADQITASNHIPAKATLAVVGFTESTSRVRLPLSNVLEDDLTSFLIERRPRKVLAKSHIDTVLRELRVTRDDLFDSRHRKQFGKLASADLIVCGTYWINSQHVIINVTVVDIEQGLALFSSRVKIRKSQFAKYLLK